MLADLSSLTLKKTPITTLSQIRNAQRRDTDAKVIMMEKEENSHQRMMTSSLLKQAKDRKCQDRSLLRLREEDESLAV